MRLGTGIGYATGIKEAAARAADLERAGVDIVWVADAYGVDGVSPIGTGPDARRAVEKVREWTA